MSLSIFDMSMLTHCEIGIYRVSEKKYRSEMFLSQSDIAQS